MGTPAAPGNGRFRVLVVEARRCHLHDTEIPLRLKEFELLTLLARHAGEAVS